MELPADKIVEMMTEAFDCGYIGHVERAEVVDGILKKFNISEKDDIEVAPPKDDEQRIYSVEELKLLPVDTEFIHSTLGKCRINQRHGEKYVTFDNPGYNPAALNVDGYPWDLPMKRC